MRFASLLGAVVVVALLMVIGMRQRWIPGKRGRWEPDARGAWEPGARGRWEPGRDVGVAQPRVQWLLAAIGWGFLLPGMLLALLLENQVIAFIAFAVYVVTWIARIILVDWSRATGSMLRAIAVVRPLAFAGGIALGALTRSIWWFVVGGIVFIGIPLTTELIRSRRNRRVRPFDSRNA